MALVRLRSDKDMVEVRALARGLARSHGFDAYRTTAMVTIVSELARNIMTYAGEGEIEVSPSPDEKCLLIEARDRGPGIENIAAALQTGFSTSGSLGIGLPGVRRLADEFDIASTLGEGTTVKVKICQRSQAGPSPLK